MGCLLNCDLSMMAGEGKERKKGKKGSSQSQTQQERECSLPSTASLSGMKGYLIVEHPKPSIAFIKDPIPLNRNRQTKMLDDNTKDTQEHFKFKLNGKMCGRGESEKSLWKKDF